MAVILNRVWGCHGHMLVRLPSTYAIECTKVVRSILKKMDCRGRDRMDLQLPMQLVPITTKIVSSNIAQGEVYPVQHCVIKFVSDLPHACSFLRVLRFSYTNTSLHNKSEMLLKVALNTTYFVFHYQTDWKGRISSVSKIKNKRLFATEYLCHR